MSIDDARYVIFIDDWKDAEVVMTAPLADDDCAYLFDRIVPALRPMSDDQYLHGPLVILHTMARFSYILGGSDVFWCVEWDPGLLVIRFSPEKEIDWAAVRSPIPEFGGREPDPDDDPDYDEIAVERQLNLVFIAWDAQFDAKDREWNLFERAGPDVQTRFRAALAHAQSLGERAEILYSEENKFGPWREACKKNLAEWAGKGLRLPP